MGCPRAGHDGSRPGHHPPPASVGGEDPSTAAGMDPQLLISAIQRLTRRPGQDALPSHHRRDDGSCVPLVLCTPI